MRADSELMIITKLKDLVNYCITISEKAPKKFRFTLVSKIDNISLELLESSILANEIELGDDRRKLLQKEIIGKLKVLDAYCLTARQVQCILPKQYEVISRLIVECIKLTRAWIKSDENRINKTT